MNEEARCLDDLGHQGLVNDKLETLRHHMIVQVGRGLTVHAAGHPELRLIGGLLVVAAILNMPDFHGTAPALKAGGAAHRRRQRGRQQHEGS